LDAHLVYATARRLVWGIATMGNPLAERVAGADIVPLLIQVAAQTEGTHLLAGGLPTLLSEQS